MARLTKRTLHGWELAAPCAPGVPLATLARYENIGSAHQFRHLSELNTPKSPYPDGDMTDCYGNEFVPYVVLTEKMLNKIQACTYSMDIFNQVAKMTTNYCVWKKVTDYLVQCSDIIADKVENAKAQG